MGPPAPMGLPSRRLRFRHAGSSTPVAPVDPSPAAGPVALTVGLLVLLALPTVIWVARRSWAQRDTTPKSERSGPKHRWWQP
jgi:hypothetical protein